MAIVAKLATAATGEGLAAAFAVGVAGSKHRSRLLHRWLLLGDKEHDQQAKPQ